MKYPDTPEAEAAIAKQAAYCLEPLDRILIAVEHYDVAYAEALKRISEALRNCKKAS